MPFDIPPLPVPACVPHRIERLQSRKQSRSVSTRNNPRADANSDIDHICYCDVFYELEYHVVSARSKTLYFDYESLLSDDE